VLPPTLDALELAGPDEVAVEEVTGPDDSLDTTDSDAEEVVAKLELDSIVTVPLLTRVVVMVTTLVEVDSTEEGLPVMPPTKLPDGVVGIGMTGTDIEVEVRVSGQTVVD